MAHEGVPAELAYRPKTTMSHGSAVPFEVAALIGQDEGTAVGTERKVVDWLRLNSVKDPHGGGSSVSFQCCRTGGSIEANCANAVIGRYDGTVGADPR